MLFCTLNKSVESSSHVKYSFHNKIKLKTNKLPKQSWLFNVQFQGMVGIVVFSYSYVVCGALSSLAEFYSPVKNITCPRQMIECNSARLIYIEQWVTTSCNL